MTQTSIGFVSFAGGHLRWKFARIRISRQVKASKCFDKIEIYSEKKLRKIISPEIAKFISANSLGYGLWIWKPIIILDFLENNPKCESILYLDAGCDFNDSNLSLKKWNEYLNFLKKSDAVFFQTTYLEESYTKKELVKAVKNEVSDLKTGQFHAAAFLMNRKYAIDFCEKWLEYMSVDEFKLLTKEGSRKELDFYESYIDYRYDQSIFSLMVKREQNVKILQANLELDFAPYWTDGLEFPILTSRNRSIIPVLKIGVLHRILRRIERRVIRTYNTYIQHKEVRKLK
jgi:hypothetical protein